MIYFLQRLGEPSFIDSKLQSEQRERLRNIHALIEGFESPLGMELLATVDYVISNSEKQPDFEELKDAIYNWGAGDEGWGQLNKEIMKDDYIKLAHDRLMEYSDYLYCS